MKIRVWVKCALNLAATEHPSFFSGQWGIMTKPAAEPYRHRDENNVEAPWRQQTKSLEKETHRRRWARIKSETVPPLPHQQHFLCTSNEHQLPFHLSPTPFLRIRRQWQNGILKTLLDGHPNWYGAGAIVLILY